MSNSRKKQQARKRAAEDIAMTAAEAPAAVAAATAPVELGLPAQVPQPLDRALYELAVAAATNVGQMREEGDRLAYVYNGDDIALKYVEPSDDGLQPGSLLVAAFRRGVVFQVRGETQLVYQAGEWERALAQLASADPPADRDEPDDSLAAEDGPEDEEDGVD